MGWKLMDPTPGEAKLLGVAGDYQAQNIDHDDVKKVLTRISKEGALNARQAMEAAKGAFSVGASPAFPPDVELVTCLPSNGRARVQEGEQPEQDLPKGGATGGYTDRCKPRTLAGVGRTDTGCEL